MRKVVSVGIDIPAAVNEVMFALSCLHGVKHDRQITAGGIFHAGGYIHAADCHTMLLIFHGAGTDGDIGKDILHITPVVRVKHLICGGQFRFFHCVNVHFTHGDQTAGKVRFLFGIGLADNSLIALSGSTGLVGINAGDQDQLVLHLFVDFGEPAYIVTDSRFVVSRTGADNDQKFIAFAGEHITYLGITLRL